MSFFFFRTRDSVVIVFSSMQCDTLLDYCLRSVTEGNQDTSCHYPTRKQPICHWVACRQCLPLVACCRTTGVFVSAMFPLADRQWPTVDPPVAATRRPLPLPSAVLQRATNVLHVGYGILRFKRENERKERVCELSFHTALYNNYTSRALK